MATQSFLTGMPQPETIASGSAVSRADFATGMQLVRAACLQTTRLQLAMQRHDAQPTLESLDSLAAIDREIENFVNSIATSGAHGFEADPDVAFDDTPMPDLEKLIALQKISLATEKMALVSGSSGPLFRESEVSQTLQTEAPGETPPDLPVLERMVVSRSEYQSSGNFTRLIAFATILFVIAGAVGWYVMQG